VELHLPVDFLGMAVDVLLLPSSETDGWEEEQVRREVDSSIASRQRQGLTHRRSLSLTLSRSRSRSRGIRSRSNDEEDGDAVARKKKKKDKEDNASTTRSRMQRLRGKLLSSRQSEAGGAQSGAAAEPGAGDADAGVSPLLSLSSASSPVGEEATPGSDQRRLSYEDEENDIVFELPDRRQTATTLSIIHDDDDECERRQMMGGPEGGKRDRLMTKARMAKMKRTRVGRVCASDSEAAISESSEDASRGRELGVADGPEIVGSFVNEVCWLLSSFGVLIFHTLKLLYFCSRLHTRLMCCMRTSEGKVVLFCLKFNPS
jgi:hypothetical protein